MAFYDFSANRQSDSGARVLFARVEPLEHLKDALEVLRLDADSVVLNGKSPLTPVGSGGNGDFRPAFIAIFDGVPNQILEQLRKLRGIGDDSWQRSDANMSF
jgi:hypothetical protein